MDIRAETAIGRPRDPVLWRSAQKLEATFVAEMLKHGGLVAASGPFGGGSGEDQFASFLREEQARLVVEAGGLGLSEALYKTLLEDRR